MAKPNNKNLAILRPGLVAATMLGTRWLIPIAQEPAQAALVAVSYACAALFALLLFRSCSDGPSRQMLTWSLTVTVLLAAMLMVDPLTRTIYLFIPRLLMAFFLLAATVLIASQRISTDAAVAVLATLMFLPIWAAPAVELAGNPATMTNAVVATSPMTIFAVSLDLDYLRTSWFYSHSALGSMRYAYPDWLHGCLLLSVLPVAALLRPLQFLPIRLVKEAQQ